MTKPDDYMAMDDDGSDAAQTRGTVVIVSIFGGLVVLGWLLMFFGLFVPRGTH